MVKHWSTQPLDWQSISEVRDRLILAWRLVQLARSVDLARLYRHVSFVDTRPFVWIQRKGWLQPRWEEVIRLPDVPNLCPWTLLRQSVALTAALPGIAPRSPVLRALVAPLAPLYSKTVGSITSKLLEKFGVSRCFWGAHSTRGPGVAMYKRNGINFGGSL